MKQAPCTLVLAALMTLLGCSSRFTPATPPQADPIGLTLFATHSTWPLAEALATDYNTLQSDVLIRVQRLTHHDMIGRVRQQVGNYGLSLHAPMPGDQWVLPLAWDAVVLVVNPLNPVTSLQSDDVRRIYQGFVDNWSAFGGNDVPIVPYSRELGADVRLEFERLVMGRRLTTPNARLVPGPDALLTAIAQDVGGVGYVPFSRLSSVVRPLALDGAMPTGQTIAANLYPLRSTLYLIGSAAPGGQLQPFVAWLQSRTGQERIEAQYVPLLNAPARP